MNYEAKRLKLIELLTKAEGNADKYAVKTIRNTMEHANNVAKIDIKHANGILDRLLKNKFCVYIMEEGKKKDKNEENVNIKKNI